MPLITGDPTSADIRVLAPLAYILPSYVLYAVLLKAIFFHPTKKQFSSSFYTIFGVSSVVNIVYSITYYLYYRVTNAPAFLPFLSTFPETGFLITFIPFVMFNTMYIQDFLDLLLCFNRFTVLILRARYQSFWQRHCLWLIVVCCLACIPFTWMNWWTDGRIRIINATAPEQGYRWDFYNQNAFPWWKNALNLAVVTLSCAIPALAMNLYVSYKLIEQRYSALGSSTNPHKVSSQDVQHFIFNVFIFFNQIANFIIQMLFYTVTNSEQRTDMFRIQYWCVDINTLTPAWFLLITSKAIRRSVANMVFCQTVSAIGDKISSQKKVSTIQVFSASVRKPASF